MTWNELKEFCNELGENVLENKVVLWRECEAISPISAETLDEDQYVNPLQRDEGCFPKSEAEDNAEGLEKVYDKGDPILHEVF